MATRLKNSLSRTVKANIALGSLPDHEDGVYDDVGDDEDDDDDVDDEDGGGANPPVCLFRACQPQLPSQACRLLLRLARLHQHVTEPSYQ